MAPPPDERCCDGAPPPLLPPPITALRHYRQGKFALPPLPYDYSALEPVIGEQTMRFHHDQHHGTYVSNLNNATADAAPELLLGASLTDAVRMVGTGQLPQDVETAVR